MIRNTAKVLAVAALAASLSACISVFPKTKAASLYRFGEAEVSVPKGPPGAMFGVLKTPSAFTRAAAGDRILTSTNGEVAYIAGARWVSPAFVLFEEATARAFENDPGRARLIGRGEVAKADMMLRLEVRTFEADYVDGPKAAPEIVVRVRAVLNRSQDRALVGDQVFEAKVKAADNRVGAIVPAFDQATAKVLGDIVAWTNAAGPGLKN
ncbi:ABC-type transport auxiliary lipoprotein family protein [Caulobacter sp. RL271]|jgi:cholesterol transport system auxiliary component|uniref:ABC-type transport auxiliary lipoprotein family protein n=1 Tax=Caulobacter segnis TaxID=88688 RepID=A0ABY5A1B0_9CAUL|nr:ABC-type transport auxiliary lipoprotein family protein [Caulobacter segnis]USQ98606.1 ABC-type transport auxiliary lipoprotein family protein [Caulobacter segnis]